jgi:hypothetical protein
MKYKIPEIYNITLEEILETTPIYSEVQEGYFDTQTETFWLEGFTTLESSKKFITVSWVATYHKNNGIVFVPVMSLTSDEVEIPYKEAYKIFGILSTEWIKKAIEDINYQLQFDDSINFNKPEAWATLEK